MTRIRAFTLLEALVALAILGVALTSSIALMAQYQVLDRRVAGQLEAQRSIEAQLEALRGGLDFPRADGVHDLAAVREAQAPVEDLGFELDVAVGTVDGLYDLVLVASYTIAGRPYQRRLELLLWRP